MMLHRSKTIGTLVFLCAFFALWTGCAADDDDALNLYTPEPDTPEAVAYDSGLTRYLDVAKPTVTKKKTFTLYEFDEADGPVCMRGEKFRSMTRKAEDSNDLVIFLQGGGACWDAFCLAVINTPTKFPSKVNI